MLMDEQAQNVRFFIEAITGMLILDGAHDEDRNGDGLDGVHEYLVAWHTNPDLVRVTALCDDEIGYWLPNIGSQHVIVAFDSCFSGGANSAIKGLNQPGVKAGPKNQVLSNILSESKLFLACSQENQPFWEDLNLAHGVFSYALLKGFGGFAIRRHPRLIRMVMDGS